MHFSAFIYQVLQIFSVGSHCQGIVTSPFHLYIAFMPLQFLMCISIITVYKVHYCIIIKHARSLNTPQNNQNYSYIYARALNKIQETSKLKMFLEHFKGLGTTEKVNKQVE